MTRNEVIAAWNPQADYMNSWQHLGEDEKLEWAMKLEREACEKACEANDPDDGSGYSMACKALAKLIKARGNT